MDYGGSIAGSALDFSVEEQGLKPILKRELKKSILICQNTFENDFFGMINFVWKSEIIFNLYFPNFYIGSSSSIASRALDFSGEEQGV